MSKAVPLLCGLSLSPFLAAQDKTTTSPPGWETIEGTDYSAYFGWFQDARYQFIDVEFVGAGVKTIKQVGYRYDWSASSLGRNWQKVTLHVSQRNASPLSLTFNANSAGTPTKVFDASVTWPPKPLNLPGGGPATWLSSLAFPFSSLWPYFGQSGLVLDYLFTGGVVPSLGYCYLDASDMPGYGNDGTARSLGVSYCRDSTCQIYPAPGTFLFSAATYVHDHIAPSSFSNMIWVGNVQSYCTAPNAPVVYVFSTRGSLSGICFPAAACGRLHIDFSIPPIVLVLKANAYGTMYTNNQPLLTLPYSPAYVGMQLFGQAAWNDSLTGNLLLTNGYRVTIASQPPDLKRGMLYRSYAPFTTAEGIEKDPLYNPIPLYTYL